MSITYSPTPSDSGSAGVMVSSCNYSIRGQHVDGEYLKIDASKSGHVDFVAHLTPQPSPTRRRPEEAILRDDLRLAREEVRSLRQNLQKMQEERDRWKQCNNAMPLECYEIIKENGPESNVSLRTLQYLDAPAAIRRLEAHDKYIQASFGQVSCDLAATVQVITLEIQLVKTNIGGDSLHWRLYSALNLMLHILRGLRRVFTRTPQDAGASWRRIVCDDYLKSNLKSADVQPLSALNEVRERGMDGYYQAFRERFAPEYDIIHNECGLNFYEKTKALMVHTYSQRNTPIVPRARQNEVVASSPGEGTEIEAAEMTWI